MITNLTSDHPVRSFELGHWEPDNLYAFDGKNLLNYKIASTRPSDTFTVGKTLKVPKDQITLVTGDEAAIKEGQLNGIKNILTNRTLQSEFTEGTKAIPYYNNWAEAYSSYEKAIQKEAENLFRAPTFEDYQLMDYVFRPKFNSQVAPKSLLSNITSVSA